MRARKTFLLFTFIATCFFANAQLSEEFSKISDSLSRAPFFHYEHIGIEHRTSELWQYARRLDTIASSSELRTLLEHEKSIVRCYAFQSLCNRSEDVYDFLLTHLNDYDRLNTLHYDLLNTNFVSDFYISESREILDSQQIEKIDSTLIFDPDFRLSWKTALIKRLPTDSKYYQAIKTAAEKGDGTALVTLAKFQKQEDKELILQDYSVNENNFRLIKAVREFPDPIFYPYLTKKFKSNWNDRHHHFSEWRILYQALAQYPDEPETIQLFERTLKAKGKFKKQRFGSYLKVAILKYPNPNFEPFLAKIRLDEFYEREVQKLIEMD